MIHVHVSIKHYCCTVYNTSLTAQPSEFKFSYCSKCSKCPHFSFTQVLTSPKSLPPFLDSIINDTLRRTQHSMEQFWLSTLLTSRQASQLRYCLLERRESRTCRKPGRKPGFKQVLSKCDRTEFGLSGMLGWVMLLNPLTSSSNIYEACDQTAA